MLTALFSGNGVGRYQPSTYQRDNYTSRRIIGSVFSEWSFSKFLERNHPRPYSGKIEVLYRNLFRRAGENRLKASVLSAPVSQASLPISVSRTGGPGQANLEVNHGARKFSRNCGRFRTNRGG